MDLRKAIYASLLCVLTGSAVADEKRGFTLGVGIGQANAEDNENGIGFDSDATSFKLFAGYQLMPNFGVELAYIDGGEFDDTFAGVDIETEVSALQASIIGTIPVNEQFSLYGRTGFLQWDGDTTFSAGTQSASTSDDGTDFAYGLGASLALQKTTLRLEYEGADLDGTDFTLISLSAVFSF